MEKELVKEKVSSNIFDEDEVIHELKHYLPAQSPLKDFIHHNTLHAFQNLKFDEAIRKAEKMFGYKTSLPLDEFRKLYKSGKIIHANLERVIVERKGVEGLNIWLHKMLEEVYDPSNIARIGELRSNWRSKYYLNIDSVTHPKIFRILCSYLDQGIAIWKFPEDDKGFLTTLREIERHSVVSLFNSRRVREQFLNTRCEIPDLLKELVGDERLYKQYIFDQQFAHQGWSGMVSAIEDQPQTLLDLKKISVKELIILECLLEIDTLDQKFGRDWAPLRLRITKKRTDLFDEVQPTELTEIMYMWQCAYEWSYYDNVLNGLKMVEHKPRRNPIPSFQALFCIDDRECSLRRYIEQEAPNCETFGTPGFFSVEFFFKPEHGKFYSKLCPAPVTPKYLIKELNTKNVRKTDVHFTGKTHSLFRGWFISTTLGFWSACRLFLQIFRPKLSPAAAVSFHHMDKYSKLTIEKIHDDHENGLQVGFTTEEMADRVEGLLKSIGLVKDFSPIVYLIGHGSSSVNNPHYAGYDCGACSGRPGSVNARVACYMANKREVRQLLLERGILIPGTTQFVGGLHDTSRDEFMFFDEENLTPHNLNIHKRHVATFNKALDLNAKERSRRLVSIDSTLPAEVIHEKVRLRSVSIFEPRPELNHATNTLCVVGGRHLTKALFLDRRAFMNSYDHKIDPEGKILAGIMRPLGPVCGGINLEYFFSRVDNHKLGAGTKLPHNVMGLFGVANGIDGDLRPGLPSQMIEVHDPMRLMLLVEHYPEVVLNVIKSADTMYEWYGNEWMHLIAIHPETKQFYLFKKGKFELYEPLPQKIEVVSDMTPIIECTMENIPVHIIRKKT